MKTTLHCCGGCQNIYMSDRRGLSNLTVYCFHKKRSMDFLWPIQLKWNITAEPIFTHASRLTGGKKNCARWDPQLLNAFLSYSRALAGSRMIYDDFHRMFSHNQSAFFMDLHKQKVRVCEEHNWSSESIAWCYTKTRNIKKISRNVNEKKNATKIKIS